MAGGGGGSGDIESVGACSTGPCFQSELTNLIFASPNGSTGVMLPRAMVNNDLPIVGVPKGGTGLSASVEDAVMVGSGTGTWQSKVMPECNATTGKIQYTTSTNAFTCGTDQSGGAGSFDGNVTGTFQLSGDIAPTALTADTHDWNPAGLSTASVIRTNQSRFLSITGIVGGTDGRILTILNNDTSPIQIISEGTSSTAANRFVLVGGDVTLMPGDSVVLIYDGTASRWRTFSVGIAAGIMDPTNRYLFVEEFMSGPASPVGFTHPWNSSGSGTGANLGQTAVGGNSTSKAFGVIRLNTGTTSAGTWGVGMGAAAYTPGLGQMIVGWRVGIDNLSTAAQEYRFYVGLHDSSFSGVGQPTDGLYFKYDRLVAGDFWQICASGNAVATCGTGSTPQPVVLGEFIWLLLITNPLWTSVDYFARPQNQTTWTYIGTIADANIPTSTELVGLQAKVEKTTGATTNSTLVDSVFQLYEVKR